MDGPERESTSTLYALPSTANIFDVVFIHSFLFTTLLCVKGDVTAASGQPDSLSRTPNYERVSRWTVTVCVTVHPSTPNRARGLLAQTLAHSSEHTHVALILVLHPV